MSGRQLSDQVKQLHPNVEVLFMSGYPDESIVHHGILDEGVLFMQKPFSPQTLLERVRVILAKQEDAQ